VDWKNWAFESVVEVYFLLLFIISHGTEFTTTISSNVQSGQQISAQKTAGWVE